MLASFSPCACNCAFCFCEDLAGNSRLNIFVVGWFGRHVNVDEYVYPFSLVYFIHAADAEFLLSCTSVANFPVKWLGHEVFISWLSRVGFWM